MDLPPKVTPTKRGTQEWRQRLHEANIKLDDEIVRKLKEAFTIGATIKEASFYAGVTDRTYFRWKEKYPELFQDIEGVSANSDLRAKQTIANRLTEIDTAKWWIERRDPSFRPHTKTEVDAKVDQRISLEPANEENKKLLDEAMKVIKKNAKV